MSPKFTIFFTLVIMTATVASADIFGDILDWALTSEAQEKKSPAGQREDEEGTSTCECEGQGCNCCVDFNLTSIIDLGGPGCVKMRYISQEAGVALNVSYGDSLLHSQVVKQKDKKGSCMDLLSELAQICARFVDLKPTADGLEGCLHFEPHVLGEVTTRYPIGCFKMGPEGMVQDQLSGAEQTEEEGEADEKPSSSGEEENEEEGESTSSILDVVNESAQQGIAFFSDLLGIKVPGKKIKSTTEKQTEEVTETAQQVSEEYSQDEAREFKPVRSRSSRLV